jgi:hypothetical protein
VITLRNPQPTAAHVNLRYLLETGDPIDVTKLVAANSRLAVNIAKEDDDRLEDARVATVVTSDVPVLVDRSTYWPNGGKPWGDGHSSAGVVEPGTRWGLAEGRVGGAEQFRTEIVLANPQSTAATVLVRYLREQEAPIVQTYTVPAHSRFTVDASTVPGLADESFGATISVTNGVPIVVERGMYWEADSASVSSGSASSSYSISGGRSVSGDRSVSGGTSVSAIALPPASRD